MSAADELAMAAEAYRNGAPQRDPQAVQAAVDTARAHADEAEGAERGGHR